MSLAPPAPARRRRLVLVIVAAFLLALAPGIRCLQVLPYPMGTGQYRVSPDGRHSASATSVEDVSFFGTHRYWYAFEISSAGERGATLVAKEQPAGAPASCEFYNDGQTRIAWHADSRQVDFICDERIVATLAVP